MRSTRPGNEIRESLFHVVGVAAFYHTCADLPRVLLGSHHISLPWVVGIGAPGMVMLASDRPGLRGVCTEPYHPWE